MIKQILALCDYSFFAEAALVMFASIFKHPGVEPSRADCLDGAAGEFHP